MTRRSYDLFETYSVFTYCENPRIIYGLLNPFGITLLTDHLADDTSQSSVLFVNTMNSLDAIYFNNRLYYDRLIESIRTFLLAHRDNKLIYLAANLSEMNLVRQSGLESIYVSQNAFISHSSISILSESKRYDAIYNAQFSSFKRHYLASRVDSIALTYGLWGSEDEKAASFADVYSMLPTAVYLNGGYGPHFVDRPYRFLERQEVNQNLCEARCGLCLSQQEGAMYASFEYLLAGLPIVTTPSYGGRDVLFPPDFTVFSDPSEEGVAEAVRCCVRINALPNEIRGAAITLAETHRQRFCQSLWEVCARSGADASTVFAAFKDQISNLRSGTSIVNARDLRRSLGIADQSD